MKLFEWRPIKVEILYVTVKTRLKRSQTFAHDKTVIKAQMEKSRQRGGDADTLGYIIKTRVIKS